jgi:hypothetical protein
MFAGISLLPTLHLLFETSLFLGFFDFWFLFPVKHDFALLFIGGGCLEKGRVRINRQIDVISRFNEKGGLVFYSWAFLSF